MKKRLTVFIIALTFVLGAMIMPSQANARCVPGAYVSSQYLKWDKNYSLDRSGIGHFIVKLNYGYLNVRNTPTMDGQIIGKLYDGDKVTTDSRSCFEPGWAQIISPSF